MRLALVLLLLLHLAAAQKPGASRCSKPKLANGHVRFKLKGALALFRCNPFFHLLGDPNILCNEETRSWSSPPPVCIAPGCSNATLGSARAGRLKGEFAWSKVSVVCFPGFQLHAASAVVVCNGTAWNSTLPLCYPANPALRCSLDDDLCGWTQDTADPDDWTQQSFSDTILDELVALPQKDHSPTGKGSFLYLDGTSSLEESALARLFSPVFAANVSSMCFSFWYHMFEESQLEGKVRVTQLQVGRKVSEAQLLFENDADTGDAWTQALFRLAPTNQSFQVVLEASCRAEENASRAIAVDDFLFSQNCPLDQVESCRNRCSGPLEKAAEACSCSADCPKKGSCCPDFAEFCAAVSDPSKPSKEASKAPTGAVPTPTTWPPPSSFTRVPSAPSTSSSTLKPSSRAAPLDKTEKTSRAPTRPSLKTTRPPPAPSSSAPKAEASRTTLTTLTTQTTTPPTPSPQPRKGPIKFQEHSFESPVGSVMGAVGGLAVLMVVTFGVAAALFRKRSMRGSSGAGAFGRDQEVAFLTKDAEEPALDFTLASPP